MKNTEIDEILTHCQKKLQKSMYGLLSTDTEINY